MDDEVRGIMHEAQGLAEVERYSLAVLFNNYLKRRVQDRLLIKFPQIKLVKEAPNGRKAVYDTSRLNRFELMRSAKALSQAACEQDGEPFVWRPWPVVQYDSDLKAKPLTRQEMLEMTNAAKSVQLNKKKAAEKKNKLPPPPQVPVVQRKDPTSAKSRVVDRHRMVRQGADVSICLWQT